MLTVHHVGDQCNPAAKLAAPSWLLLPAEACKSGLCSQIFTSWQQDMFGLVGLGLYKVYLGFHGSGSLTINLIVKSTEIIK